MTGRVMLIAAVSVIMSRHRSDKRVPRGQKVIERSLNWPSRPISQLSTLGPPPSPLFPISSDSLVIFRRQLSSPTDRPEGVSPVRGACALRGDEDIRLGWHCWHISLAEKVAGQTNPLNRNGRYVLVPSLIYISGQLGTRYYAVSDWHRGRHGTFTCILCWYLYIWCIFLSVFYVHRDYALVRSALRLKFLCHWPTTVSNTMYSCYLVNSDEKGGWSFTV